jgi:hypothetical protein
MTKRVTIRIPADLHQWLIVKAGSETARKGKQVSMNILITAILKRAREIDEKRGLSITIH